MGTFDHLLISIFWPVIVGYIIIHPISVMLVSCQSSESFERLWKHRVRAVCQMGCDELPPFKGQRWQTHIIYIVARNRIRVDA